MPAPNLVLQGEVRPAQNQTYFEVPFTVPAGTHRITVAFHNLGKAEHTVLDLGIADPFRFRGQSGGNKDHFTLSETDATPSYLPGAIPPGRWKLLISVPNIRAGVTSRFRAEVWFNSALDDSSFTEQPLNDKPGWYRGDLHMHDAHSDGSCPSQTGKSVPCPLFLTVEDAVRRGLDFIAITDHNAMSQYDDERELQPYFDKLLMIPGRELTTFHGHANEWGTTRFIDYRVGSKQVPDVNAMFREARSLGAIVSINHPESPSGEICMGCGWTATPAADMKLVTSIEVVNGGGVPATRFWEEQLRKGYRLTAVGGSDNHRAEWGPEHPASVGYPTTVVYAHDLSVAGILDGIRSGRVFIDLTGSRDRMLEMQAQAGGNAATMGGVLNAPSGQAVKLEVHVAGCSGGSVHFYIDGEDSSALPPQTIAGGDETLHATWQSDGSRHWIRVEAIGADGHRLLLGNPVYVNWGAAASAANSH
ncbi:MAG TPA: CehA/McbA family metallohydrolase [Acidobacteriaceae bacterium]|nr:CehA/McbA family metallohydrolase [Acidobacteriaceae bacterium]